MSWNPDDQNDMPIIPEDERNQALEKAAIDVVQKASIGDQNFIPSLNENDPQTVQLRMAIWWLADVLRGDDDDNEPRSEK